MPETSFEPDRLRIARELRAWTQNDLARQVSEIFPLSPAAVGQFESGSTRPSPETLHRLSDALGVPPAFLTRPIVETHEGFFRSIRRTPVRQRRRARALAHIVHDLAGSADERLLPTIDLPRFSPDLEAERAEIEQIADKVRRLWQVPAGPLADVVALMERHGVVVACLPLDSGDVDAFSLPFHDRPVAVLGADKGDRARSRFDAAHELGHLIMHGERVWGLKQVEDQAHWFAAALLMPSDDIYDELPETVDWPTLFSLKERWQVSLAALLMRAKKLGKMDDASYLAAVKAASARGWRRLEPVPLGPPERPALLAQIIAAEEGTEVCAALPAEVVKSIMKANPL